MQFEILRVYTHLFSIYCVIHSTIIMLGKVHCTACVVGVNWGHVYPNKEVGLGYTYCTTSCTVKFEMMLPFSITAWEVWPACSHLKQIIERNKVRKRTLPLLSNYYIMYDLIKVEINFSYCKPRKSCSEQHAGVILSYNSITDYYEKSASIISISFI